MALGLLTSQQSLLDNLVTRTRREMYTDSSDRPHKNIREEGTEWRTDNITGFTRVHIDGG